MTILPATRTAPSEKSKKRWPNKYAWFVVSLLLLAYTLSFIDRTIINLLVDPIRSDLQISDTQVSLLMGFSFVLFYVSLGIPIARLADRYSRRNIIIIAVVFWSIMTALCGFAKTFVMLFLARIGVGAGEAGLSPAAYSLISDYFPSNRVCRAISIYSVAVPLGTGLAYIIGASLISAMSSWDTMTLPFIGEMKPWQLIFVIVSLPAVILVPLLTLISEPERKGVHKDYIAESKGTADNASGLIAFMRLRRKVILGHLLGFSLISAADYAFLSWVPTFYFRVRGISLEETGVMFGLAYIIFGAAGLVVGARLSELMQSKGLHDAIFRISAWVASLLFVFIWLIILLPHYWSYVALIVYIFLISVPWGIAAGAIQLFTPNQYRAQLSALYLFSVSLAGMTIGPTGVALITDFFFQNDAKVGLSLAILSSICLAGAVAALLLCRKDFYDAVAAQLELEIKSNSR